MTSEEQRSPRSDSAEIEGSLARLRVTAPIALERLNEIVAAAGAASAAFDQLSSSEAEPYRTGSRRAAFEITGNVALGLVRQLDVVLEQQDDDDLLRPADRTWIGELRARLIDILAALDSALGEKLQ